MAQESSLDVLRGDIRKVTVKILRLTGKRLLLAKKIGEIKRREGLPIEDLETERELKRIVLEKCEKYGIDSGFGLKFLGSLINEAKRVQGQTISLEREIGRPLYEIFSKAKQLERAGTRILHLEVGEPDFGPPERVKRATCEAVNARRTRYTETSGMPQLREEIARIVKERSGRDISSEQVIVTPGGRFAVFLGMSSIVSPGDEVIIFDPSWPAYKQCVVEAGGRVVSVPTTLDERWSVSIDLLSKTINEFTKMIVLNSPSNPTGRILDGHALKEIVELASDNNITILSDEVYSNFALIPFKSIFEFPECKSIRVSSFSKTFGMTGFRIGYAIFEREIVKKMMALQSLTLTSVPEFVQYAALEALKCGEEAKEYAHIISKRMKVVCSALSKLPVSYYEPDGGFYIFLRINGSENADAEAFASKLLMQKGVGVVPGTAFGNYPNFIRISVCQPEEILLEGVRSIGELLS